MWRSLYSFKPYLGVGDLDVKCRILAIGRLPASLLNQVSNRAHFVQHPELGGSAIGCRVNEDTLALNHDLQRQKDDGATCTGSQGDPSSETH